MKIVVSLEVWSDENEVISHKYKRAIQLQCDSEKELADHQIEILAVGIRDLSQELFTAHIQGEDLKQVEIKS